jgi:DNA invertase Pin-like site-specific DNA recombinase
MKKLAFSYIRFSSKKQELGHSYARQAELATKWCERNNAVLDTSLQMDDKGVSGLRGKNLSEQAALGRFIKAVKDGRVPKNSYLLIESLDRLSRQDIDSAYQLFRTILNLEINIVSLKENKLFTKESLTNFADIIVTLAFMSRANEESSFKVFRLRQKWAERRANIKNKKIATKYPSWLTLSKDYTTFSPIKSHVLVINQIFTEYNNGKGVVSIARDLNQSNTPCISRRSKIWKTHYIQQLLRSRALLGEYQPHKRSLTGKKEVAGVCIPDYFPAVVPTELFQRVQFLLGKIPRDTAAKTKYGVNLFSKKIFCPYCSERMFVAYQQVSKKMTDGSRRRYANHRTLMCVSAKNGKCLNIGWRLDDFEQSFVQCSDELAVLFSPKRGEVAQLSEAVTITQRELATKNKAISNLQTLIENADVAPEGALQRWKQLEDEVTSLQKTLTAQEGALQVASDSNPYKHLGKIDLTDIHQRARVRNAITYTIEKIFVFFAGSRFQHAKILSYLKRARKSGVNRVAVAHAIRRKFNIEQTRFFVAHLTAAGKDRRLVYPTTAVGSLNEIQDAPNDPN